MNIPLYISSGILEAYVLGELTPLEMLQVERNISAYPELKDELKKIELTQEKFAEECSISPAPSVKARLIEKLTKETPEPGIVPIETSSWQKYSLAAFVALALVSSVFAFRYYYKWREADSSLTELLTQNQRIASEYNTVNQRLDKIEADLKITNSSSFERVALGGTDNAKDSKAYVYWNATTNDVYLSIESLRDLSQAKQYQLWAIVDGKPIDAGVFDSPFTGLLKMKNISGATSFAVTIEKRGGAITPTLETMQVAGSVGKG